MTHSFFVIMGGVTMYRETRERENRVYLTADGIVQLIHEMNDEPLSVVSKDAISDHSKVDLVGKSLTVLQASHTLLLVVVRLVNRTSVSALELSTCGYVLTAFINMIFWWHKPYNAQEPLVLNISNSLLNQHDSGHYDWTKHKRKPGLRESVYTTTKPVWGGLDGMTGFAAVGDKHPRWSISGMFLASSVIAGLHLTLWNAHFPTPIERWMWRVSSIVLTSISLFLALLLFNGPWTTPNETGQMPQKSKMFHALSVVFDYIMPFQSRHCPGWWEVTRDYTGIAVYLAARLYIIVECYLSLRDLPADVYSVPPWTSIIPNLG